MELRIFASGSSGNAALLSTGKGRLLLDAGISMRRVVSGLRAEGVDPATLSGILITHAHSDHISGLNMIEKYHRLPVYCTAPCAEELLSAAPQVAGYLHKIEPLNPFAVNGLTITAIPTSHDAAGSVGWRIDDGSHSMALITDLGYVSPEIMAVATGAELIVLEANYDPESLRLGPYPFYLQERIRSRYGHLSNEDSAAFAVFLAKNGAKQIVLAHLSQENNSPAMALEAVRTALERAGIPIPVTVALRTEATERLIL